MIPKTIHYCWFGRNPKPELALKCIDSWKKYCPDYEIVEWNEDNLNLDIFPQYVKDAYKEKKWAFVSDYARFWILYNYGGVYFDTDVEVIKPIDEIVRKGPFMACQEDGEKSTTVAPGLGIAANPGLGIYKELLDYYHTLSFYKEDGSINDVTIVEYTTEVLKRHGLKNVSVIQKVDGIIIYPKEYFCPKDYATGKVKCTRNTYAIHHFDGSWQSEEQKKMIRDYFRNLPRQLRRNRILAVVKKIVGETVYKKMVSVIKKLGKTS